MLRRAIPLAVLLAFALAAPASAEITVSFRSGSSVAALVENGSSGVSVNTRLQSDSLVFDFGPGSVARAEVVPLNGCSFVDNTPSTNPDVRCPRAGLARVTVQLGGGSDSVNTSGDPLTVPMTIEGGGGRDLLGGGAQDDLIGGGPGRDELDGRAGADLLSAGADAVGLVGGGGPDDLRGGTGFDLARYSGSSPLVLTIDDRPNDGAGGPLEGDNVHTDIEDLRGGEGADVITGSSVGNEIDGGGGADRIDGGAGIDGYEGGAGNDTILARDGLGERIACDEGADAVTSDDIDGLADCESVSSSGELVRDLDGDGVAKPADCDDRDPAVRPGAFDMPDNGRDEDCSGADATNQDRDRDGVTRPADCADGNPAIRPGAAETLGNRVDEDCSGRADPLQVLTSTLQTSFRKGTSSTGIRRLNVVALEAGVRVQATCRGRGCHVRRLTRTISRDTATLGLRRPLRLRRLAPGAILEVRILRADSIGTVIRLRFRRGKLPQQQTLCQAPGDAGPRRC